MADDSDMRVLAFLPPAMQDAMGRLEVAIRGTLSRCESATEFVTGFAAGNYSVVILPGSTLSAREWWTVWGVLSLLEQRPSILVCALTSDVQMWAGVLASGCYDVVVPPFTSNNLRAAVEAAHTEFMARTEP